MRKIFLLFLSVMAVHTSWAKAEEPVISGFYNRAGYSLIVVDNKEHGRYSRRLIDWAEHHKPSNKFYYNKIKSTTIEKKSCYPSVTYSQSVKDWLVSEKVGQQIISVIFNRQEDGRMDDSVVKARGLYNASAVQEMDASAAALGKEAILQDAGYSLLDKNYVQILNPYEYETISKEGLKKTSAKLSGSLYRLVLTESIIDNIFQNMWIYPEDSPEQRRHKQKLFDDMEFEFELITTEYVSYEESKWTEDDNIRSLYNKLYETFCYKLEKTTEDFIVEIPVKSIKPIKAQIGEKESLKNGDRYDAYKYVMKGDVIKPVRTAILRATTIADNKKDNKKTSEFIQVAGHSLDEGYVLRQRVDHQYMIAAIARSGGLEGYGITLDGLTRIKTNGSSGFGGIYVTYMPYDVVSLSGGKIDYINANEELYDGKWSAISAGIRLGFTRRFLRYFEAGVNLNLGCDGIFAKYDEEDVDAPDEGSGMVFTTTPGANLKINIAYPLHLVLGVDYSVLFGLGSDDTESSSYNYNCVHNTLKDVGVNRSGLGYMVGLSLSF